MINDTTNPADSRSLSRLDAWFRSVHWLSAGRGSPHVARHAEVGIKSAIADLRPEMDAHTDADVHRKFAGLCADLGFAPGDPACVGIGTSEARAARAAATITDWLTYLPRDCVRAMVKDGWHLTA